MGRASAFPLGKMGSIPVREVWIKGFPSSGVADGQCSWIPCCCFCEEQGWLRSVIPGLREA